MQNPNAESHPRPDRPVRLGRVAAGKAVFSLIIDVRGILDDSEQQTVVSDAATKTYRLAGEKLPVDHSEFRRAPDHVDAEATRPVSGWAARLRDSVGRLASAVDEEYATSGSVTLPAAALSQIAGAHELLPPDIVRDQLIEELHAVSGELERAPGARELVERLRRMLGRLAAVDETGRVNDVPRPPQNMWLTELNWFDDGRTGPSEGTLPSKGGLSVDSRLGHALTQAHQQLAPQPILPRADPLVVQVRQQVAGLMADLARWRLDQTRVDSDEVGRLSQNIRNLPITDPLTTAHRDDLLADLQALQTSGMRPADRLAHNLLAKVIGEVESILPHHQPPAHASPVPATPAPAEHHSGRLVHGQGGVAATVTPAPTATQIPTHHQPPTTRPEHHGYIAPQPQWRANVPDIRLQMGNDASNLGVNHHTTTTPTSQDHPTTTAARNRRYLWDGRVRL